MSQSGTAGSQKKSAGTTPRVGLLGWPLGHSISPALHNAAFAAVKLDWRYELQPVPAGALADRVRSLKRDGFLGCNVTIPHKEAILPFLDEVSSAVTEIGAANTVVIDENGRLWGDNTDWLGFLYPLDQQGFSLAGKRILLLGAGGAARAVAYALVQRDVSRVVVWNRTPDRAEQLVIQVGLKWVMFRNLH